jgi:hypothetical protein
MYLSQADMSVTRRHGGLGLGLAIARQLIAAHGGTISLHSEGPGRGTAAIVRIPVLQDQTRPDLEPAFRQVGGGATWGSAAMISNECASVATVSMSEGGSGQQRRCGIPPAAGQVWHLCHFLSLIIVLSSLHVCTPVWKAWLTTSSCLHVVGNHLQHTRTQP